jgi:hypothetical protein
MPWYESQLAGTVIGTILGFILAFIPNALEKRRAHKCLRLLLKAEIRSIIDQLKDRVVDVRSTLEATSKGESCEIFSSDRRIDEIFTANLVNMASFAPEHAEAIFGFYQTVGRHQGLIKALSQDKIEEGEDSAEFCKALGQVISLMEDGILRGDHLIKELA